MSDRTYLYFRGFFVQHWQQRLATEPIEQTFQSKKRSMSNIFGVFPLEIRINKGRMEWNGTASFVQMTHTPTEPLGVFNVREVFSQRFLLFLTEKNNNS